MVAWRRVSSHGEHLMGQPVVHFELWSQDPEQLSAFYTRVFDWNVNHLPEMNYRSVDTGSEAGIHGGIMQPQEGPWPGSMTFYVNVDDLAPYRERIVAAGGSIVVEEQAIPGVGSFSLFADPDGRVLGLWQQTAKEAAGS
jgi:predicted enzyme related to lactoylglutathione lyase